jgi:hypothetical protein
MHQLVNRGYRLEGGLYGGERHRFCTRGCLDHNERPQDNARPADR